MNYKIINSGSDGNAVVINNEILIDCGVAYKKIIDYIPTLKLILLTHEHSDHYNSATIRKIKQVRPGVRFGCCEWMKKFLIADGISKEQIDIYKMDEWYSYGTFNISAIELFHDVPQCGYRVQIKDTKLIYATDTSRIDHIEAKNYDYYLIEANYENVEELKDRAYSIEYYERVKKTHLSSEEATKWLLNNMGNESQYEFMHQHKEHINQRRELFLQELNKITTITGKEYQYNDNCIIEAIEDLITIINGEIADGE